MVRDYEALYILDPSLSEEETTEQIERYKQFVETRGGIVASAAKWERRRLAYVIKGHREGNYILMTFKAGPTIPSEMERAFRLADPVLRGLITRLDHA